MIGSNIASACRALLNDSAGLRWTDTEFCMWLTDGQIEAVTLKPNAHTRFAAHSLVNGSRQAFAATDAHMILDVVRNTGGNAITVCPRETLDANLPGWHASTGEAVENFVFDPREPLVFWVYPGKGASASGSVDVLYSAIPATTLALAQTLTLNDIYRPALIAYCLYRCLAKDDETGSAQKAAAYYQAFAQSLGAKAAVERGDQPNISFIPFNPSLPGAAR